MNYNSMTDTELLHYLDLYSDDPLIRRLVDVLQNTRGALVNDLENAGMDPKTWTFKTDWQDQYPGDYIIQLRNDLDRAEEELSDLQRELAQVEDERDQLKVRSVMQLIDEVNKEKIRCSVIASDAIKESNKVKEENAKLREQIDMWGRLNHVKQGA